ncbi:hypothetical protein ACIPY6_28535 [Streptomyces sp. NPDC090054]|uniref:hypothetical protein n=1 Tax=Streptomyces sp. NPDC090054 TaxID=3365933 RepID=UPI0038052C3B
MTEAPEPTVTATRYEISLLPEGDVNRRTFLLYVEYRGQGLWAVHDGHGQYDADGEWCAGMSPAGPAENWFGVHRFSLHMALELAKQLAPGITVNGHTAAEAYQARQTLPTP